MNLISIVITILTNTQCMFTANTFPIAIFLWITSAIFFFLCVRFLYAHKTLSLITWVRKTPFNFTNCRGVDSRLKTKSIFRVTLFPYPFIFRCSINRYVRLLASSNAKPKVSSFFTSKPFFIKNKVLEFTRIVSKIFRRLLKRSDVCRSTRF